MNAGFLSRYVREMVAAPEVWRRESGLHRLVAENMIKATLEHKQQPLEIRSRWLEVMVELSE